MTQINNEYKRLLAATLSGTESAPRGKRTRELIAYQTRVDMSWPVVTLPTRKVSDKFRFAEAAWILSGDNRVSSIAPFNKNISPFSDDGVRYFGAYGPKIIDQLPYVVDKLCQDVNSRQAVINIWRENPPTTKDVPCTLSLEFLIRGASLHVVATMRSSDAWLGWPYDVFNFSMVARAVIIYLKQRGYHGVYLGSLFLTAGSQHIYEPHYEVAKGVIADAYQEFAFNDESHPIIFDCCEFETVDQFVRELWSEAHAAAALPR